MKFMIMIALLCFRARLFIDALWSPVGKELTSWLSFVMSDYEIGSLGQVWCLIVSIPDLCVFSYFKSSCFAGTHDKLRLDG